MSVRLFQQMTRQMKDVMNRDLGIITDSGFVVSSNDIEANTYESGKIKVEPATGVTCSRCWQIVPSINPDELCPRCANVVNKLQK